MDINKITIPIDLNHEMQRSFIAYAMSVITDRALPDVRDGLKPVHRRILYTMFENGLTPDKAYRKCADTVGSVLGRYHPHGDASVYDAMVRMAQDFSLRYPLIDGHGNFGNIDGYPAAAYRYTESRMNRLSLHMLDDINKETVDFQPALLVFLLVQNGFEEALIVLKHRQLHFYRIRMRITKIDPVNGKR